MIITPIASSSDGNSILVDDGKTKVLLDAGISYNRLSRRVKLHEVEATLISHHHSDHCKAVPELIRRGHEVYASKGEWPKIKDGWQHEWNANVPTHNVSFDVGTLKVLPFNLRHDTPEPLGFMIKSTLTGKKCVYIVDSAIITFGFKGVTHWLLEANHFEAGLENSSLDDIVKERIRNNHMSFENLQKFLATSDMSKSEAIHLLHLSNGNSNEKLFTQKLQQQYGVPVYCHKQ